MNRIYFAGPDIFFKQWDSIKAQIEAICAAKDILPVFPADSPSLSHQEIASRNINLIRSSDAICANMMAFRGCEPDSGTVFELSYAFAMGKICVFYAPPISLLERVHDSAYGPILNDQEGWPIQDKTGAGVEGFGLSQNLMIAALIPSCTDRIEAILFLSKCFSVDDSLKPQTSTGFHGNL